MHQSPSYSGLLLSILLLQIIISEAKTTTFNSSALAYSSPYGDILWSDPNSWMNGVPADGDTVIFISTGNGDGGPSGRGTLDIGSAQITLSELLFDDFRVKIIGTGGKLTVSSNLTLGVGSFGCALELSVGGVLYTGGLGFFDGATVTIRGTMIIERTIGFVPPVTVNIASTGIVNISSSYSDVSLGNPRDTDNGNSVVNNQGTITIWETIDDDSFYAVGVCAKVVNTGTIRVTIGSGSIGTCAQGFTTYNINLNGSIAVSADAYLYLGSSIYTVDPNLVLSGNGTIWLVGGQDISINATLNLNHPLNWPTGGIRTDSNARFTGDANMNIERLTLTNYYFDASTTSVITVANFTISGSDTSSCMLFGTNGLQCLIQRKIIAQTFFMDSDIAIWAPGHIYLTGNGTIAASIAADDTGLKYGSFTVAPGADLVFVSCCIDTNVNFYNNGTTRTAWAFRDGTVPFYSGSYVYMIGKGVSAGTWIAEGYPLDDTGDYGDFTFAGNSDNGDYWQYEAGTEFKGIGFFRMNYATGAGGGANAGIAASTHVVNAPFTAENFAFGESAFISGAGDITVTGSFGNIALNPDHSTYVGTASRKFTVARFSGGSGMEFNGPELIITESAYFSTKSYTKLLQPSSVVTLLPGTVSWLEDGGFDDGANSAGYVLVQGNLTLDANGDSLSYARIGAATIVVAGTGVVKTNQDLVSTCITTTFGAGSDDECSCNATSPWCYADCNPATGCDTRLQVANSASGQRAASIEQYGAFSMWGAAHLEVKMFGANALNANPDTDDTNSPDFGGDVLILGRSGDTVNSCQLSGTLTVNFVGATGIPGNPDTPVSVPAGSMWRFLYVYGNSRCTGGFANVVGINLPTGMVLGINTMSYTSTESAQNYYIYYAKACQSTDTACKASYEVSAQQKDFVKGVDKPCPTCNITDTTTSSQTSSSPTSSSPTSSSPTSSTPTSSTPTSSTPTSSTPTSSTPTSTTTSGSAITTSVFAVIILVIMILIQ